MANLAKTTVFTSTSSPKETPLDKTTRIVKRITEDDAVDRHEKTDRLRKARFENDANMPAEAITTVSSKANERR